MQVQINTSQILAISVVASILYTSPVLAEKPPSCTEPNPELSLSLQAEQGRAYVSCLKRVKLTDASAPIAVRTLNFDGKMDEAIKVAEDVDADDAEVDQAKRERKQNFTDLDWGIGLGVAFGSGQRVETAIIENDVVRVTKDNTDEARVFLEIHKFFAVSKSGNIGFGPFAMASAGGKDGDVLSSFGLGLMVGFRRKNLDAQGSKSIESGSWNLGAGYIWDNDVQVLGDGFVENAAPPMGLSEIRFKEETQKSFVLIFSSTF